MTANTWLVGEEVYTPDTAGDALRYMDNPTLDEISYANHPGAVPPAAFASTPASPTWRSSCSSSTARPLGALRSERSAGSGSDPTTGRYWVVV